MSTLKKTEDQLAGVFKDLPKLPNSSQESLVKAWPWIALVFGVIQVFAAWGLWKFMQDFGRVSDYVNSLSIYLNGAGTGLSSSEKLFVYVGIAALAIDAVLLLMAYAPLKARSRRGWELLFIASLVNVAYAVVALFMRNHGVGDFIMSLVGSAVGFYLLFQVRDKYTKKAA